MLQVPGYDITDRFFESCGYIFYRGFEQSSKAPVIIKVPLPENESYRYYAYLQHEYMLLRNISSEGIIHIRDMVETGEKFALILEPFAGTLLAELISKSSLTVRNSLSIAMSIATTLGDLHKKGIINGNIDPTRIIAERASGTVHMPDFTRAVILPPGETEVSAANFYYPGPVYISPEQTGCINRLVDYRTDFYLLGILLYEMLTGKPPFRGDDITTLIHSHISKKPQSPSEIKRNIPPAVSMVVMKLLEKNAENRYQSSWGIRSDLEKCMEQIIAGRDAHNFKAGEDDRSETLTMPIKLYGREKETSLLYRLFEKVSSGKSMLLVINGDPGSGKTSFAQELKKYVIQRGGYFIEGAFTEKGDMPYSAFTAAFSDFARLLITEKKEKFEKWRETIINSVGQNGKIITDLFPSMELVTGRFNEISELGPGETGNRFNIVIQNFFNCISAKEHPLVLFLDDMQYADNESLKLVETIMADTGSRHLMMICATDNMPSAGDVRIKKWIDNINRISAQLDTINLVPLNDATVDVMIQEILHTRDVKTKELSKLIIEKTLGNPGHINRFIKKIRAEGIFTLDSSTGEWQWDNEKVRALEAEDDIISIYADRISGIDGKARNVLAVASCIGMTFTVEILSAVSGISYLETSTVISSALNQRLIVQLSDAYEPGENDAAARAARYRFLHTRIQETFYSLLENTVKEDTHLSIGQYLLDTTPETAMREKLFEIIAQMNNGYNRITDPARRRELAAMNLEAGVRVKSTGAYTQAVSFLSSAVKILADDSWQNDYQLTFNIYRELSECQYLSGNNDKAEELFNFILERAQSDLDRGEINNIRIILYANAGKFIENNRTCIETLKLFGLNIADPDNPRSIEDSISEEMALFKKNLGRREIADLESLPETQLAETRICLKLIMNMLSSAYVSNPPLLGAAVLKGLNMSLEFGASPHTTFIFSTCGLFFASRYKDYKTAYEFGLLASRFNERFNHPATKSNVAFVFGNFISSWRGHISESIIYLRKGFEEGINNGDFVYGSFCATSIPRYLLAYGHHPLKDVLNEIDDTMAFFKRIKNFASLDRQKLTKHAVLNLMGRLPDPLQLSSDEFDETSHIIQMNEIHYGTGIALYYYYKLFTLFLAGYYDEAFGMAVEGMKNLKFVVASIQEADMVFYYSLCMTRLFSSFDADRQNEYMSELKANEKMLEYWNINSPDNFSARYYLVKAEILSLQGDNAAAIEYFDRSITESARTGFKALQALCCDLASVHHEKNGHQYLADSLLADAIGLYSSWGCESRLNCIKKTRGPAVTRINQRTIKQEPARESHPSAAAEHEEFRKPADIIDLISVVRASQAISGEIVLNSLIDRLMKVIVESSGAQNGILFIEHENLGTITARAASDGETIRVLQVDHNIDESHYPESVINYVKKTGETVLLGDATKRGLFTADPYITENRPGSILCIPVRQKTGMTVILYLENRLATEIFNPARMDIIYLLCSQIAISLENALNFEVTNRIKENLRESEEKYRVLFENIQDVFYRSDTNGRITLFSPSANRLFGYSPDEFYMLDIATELYVNPYAREKLLETLKKVGYVEDYEVQLKKKDGTVFWVSTNTHIYYDKNGNVAGIEGILRDITARKTAEAQIMAEKERLAVTLRSIGEGVIVTDINTCIILINRVAEKLTGFSQEEAAGINLAEIFKITDDRNRNICNEIINRLLSSGELVEIETGLHLTDRQGIKITIALSAAPIRDEMSRLIGAAIVFRDITEKQKMEEELLKTQKLESISIFAGGIAHDFNNLLAGILGNVSLSKHSINDRAKLKKRLDEIESASIRAKDLTQQLLTFSRGGVPIKKTTSIVQVVMESAKFVLSGSNVKCEYYIDDSVSSVEADEGQMNQVFNNILINARQAMPDGGIINIKIHNETVSPGTDRADTGEYVHIDIEDHGSGIPKENLGRIFDPFFTTKEKGNGLGLATTYSIIKKHDGSINVTSEIGKGTVFTILLPASENVAINLPEDSGTEFKGSGRILIMDDEDIILSVSSEMVEMLGYESVLAKDGNEVVWKYRDALESGKPYEFVIMDLTIPGGTGGKEAIAKLRELDPGVRAIVSSGYSNDPVMSDYKKYGFSGIIVKPYKLEELRNLLQSMTREKS